MQDRKSAESFSRRFSGKDYYAAFSLALRAFVAVELRRGRAPESQYDPHRRSNNGLNLHRTR
jgi:hypothetical protein